MATPYQKPTRSQGAKPDTLPPQSPDMEQRAPVTEESQPTLPRSNPNPGWFKAVRGTEPLDLIRANPNAYALAAVIAHRARWHEGFNAYGLGLGEALLGDYKAYGLTRQKYRTAMRQLKKWGFATFTPTKKGTTAKLTDTRLFDVFPSSPNHPANQRPTSSQPTANHQVTTNEEHKNKEHKNQEQQEKERPRSPSNSKFIPPTVEQVKSEAEKIKLPETEAERFFDHYESNGWRVGHNRMNNWPASLKNWKRNFESGLYSPGRKPRDQAARTRESFTERWRKEHEQDAAQNQAPGPDGAKDVKVIG